MPTAEFNARAQPQPVVYNGPEGYRRMLGEIRESLYEQVPGARGRIEIFDHSNPDVQGEWDRIAKSLGTTFEALESGTKSRYGNSLLDSKYDEGGLAIYVHTGHQNVALAFGANLKEDYTNDSIRREGRRVVHEVFHNINSVLKPSKLEVSSDDLDGTAASRFVENYAEMGSTDLLMKNGRAELLIALPAEYQMRQGNPMANVSRQGEASIGKPIEDDRAQADRYDHADGYRLLQQLQKNDPAPPPVLVDFNLKGWQQSIDRAEFIRGHMTNMSMDAVNLDRAQDLALGPVREYFITKAAQDIEPMRAALDKANADPEPFAKLVFNTYTPKNYPYEKVSGVEAEAASIVLNRQDEWRDWLKERSFIPKAERILNGYDLLDGRATEVIGSNPAKASRPDQLMGQAALQWAKTGDPLDRFAFVEFARAADAEIWATADAAKTRLPGRDSPLSRLGFAERSTPESLRAQSGKLQDIASGESYDDVYKTGGYTQDRFSEAQWSRGHNNPTRFLIRE